MKTTRRRCTTPARLVATGCASVRGAGAARWPISRILAAVAAHYDVEVAEILAHRRTAHLVIPRQVAVYLAKALTGRSLPDIGRRFGGRDHTTILHGVRKIAALMQRDADLARERGGADRRFWWGAICVDHPPRPRRAWAPQDEGSS